MWRFAPIEPVRANVAEKLNNPGLAPKEAAVNKTLGVILVGFGLFGLAWGGFTYTTREKVVDIGPIHATREKKHDVPVAPLAGAAALIGGIVLLITSGKK